MSSEEIVRYDWRFVLVIVLGLGFRELYALRRDNRKAREQEAAESAGAHGAGGRGPKVPVSGGEAPEE